MGTSTKGGFQTLENLLAGDHPQANNPALLTLKQHIAQAINDYVGLLVEQECARAAGAGDVPDLGLGRDPARRQLAGPSCASQRQYQRRLLCQRAAGDAGCRQRGRQDFLLRSAPARQHEPAAQPVSPATSWRRCRATWWCFPAGWNIRWRRSRAKGCASASPSTPSWNCRWL